jgi:hypothetical protein
MLRCESEAQNQIRKHCEPANSWKGIVFHNLIHKFSINKFRDTPYSYPESRAYYMEYPGQFFPKLENSNYLISNSILLHGSKSDECPSFVSSEGFPFLASTESDAMGCFSLRMGYFGVLHHCQGPFVSFVVSSFSTPCIREAYGG